MFLALDVGNSHIAAALYAGNGESAEPDAKGRFELNTAASEAELETCMRGALKARWDKVHAAGIASVVPEMDALLAATVTHMTQVTPLFVSSEAPHGLGLRYRPHSALGADRLCNAVAAFERFGGPVVVADFGTATKLEAVDAGGNYLGGAILPGIGISLEALYRRASKLSEVPLALTPHVIGTSTAEALQSGIAYGFGGQADALVARFRAALGAETQAVITGGWAGFVHHHMREEVTMAPDLTLDGVRRVCSRWREHEA